MENSFKEVVRRHTGPPVNIEGIIRAMGVELDRKAPLDKEISGQLERLPNGKFKISVNKNDGYFRQRFTMAHELGHFLLHAHLIGDGVDDSKAYRSEPQGTFYNQAITPREETQANQFAANLLLPEAVIRKLATPGASLKQISVGLKASLPATKIRMRNLGYVLGGENEDIVESVPQFTSEPA